MGKTAFELMPIDRVRYVVERAAWDAATRLGPGETIRLPAEWWPVFYDKQKANGKLPAWVQRDAPPAGQHFNGHPILWVPR
ncbi:MAG: hypothetical protein SGI88_15605 [Candidatus Hydrogenedentes bacterium]|nr:hypothetical protein [Candidatus Hydrogenedentota bacterium]